MSTGLTDAVTATVDVAVVGCGGAFPGCRDLEEFWRNVVEGIDTTRDVPSGRWLLGPELAFDPEIGKIDRVYAVRGGFIEPITPDSTGLHLPEGLLTRLDPSYQLAIQVARVAWESARTERIDRRRVGIIFGNIVLPTEAASSLTREVVGKVFLEGLDIPSDGGGDFEPRNAFPAGLPAALVAMALGLGGPAYTIDAACASSLYALKLAIDELRSGRVDVMLSGGVSRPDPLYTQMGFSQLRALSAHGRPAPFDALGDGLIVGEGAGLFVLKRLDDAIEHGDSILGVIRGIGISNDRHGDLLAPSSEGQLRAMRSAYQQAGWSPEDVDLIECHATGTPLGDSVELESLKSLWDGISDGNGTRGCVLGSVKSNVGHMLTAAGAAGLMKLLLAINRRTLPPTANYQQPSPRIELDRTPFRILTRSEPWPESCSGRPRRAALSGFGFGGINAHLLIEEWKVGGNASRGSLQHSPIVPTDEPIAIIGMATHFGPFEGLSAFQERVFHRGDPGPQDSGIWPDLPGTLPGYYLDAFEMRIDRVRIPPRELEELQPQQSLLLKVAAEAVADAAWSPSSALRTGVLVGLGLDLNTTDFHLRWWLESRLDALCRSLGRRLTEEERGAWLEELRRQTSPPLTPNRTMGSLGGLVASRVARELRIGGPSFSVSCDENSGIQALEIAAGWLRRNEIDTAIVGAVDLAGDVRLALARHRLEETEKGLRPPASQFVPGEGAVVLVLKRLDDAVRDGDRIYALVRGIATSYRDPSRNDVEVTIEQTGIPYTANSKSIPPADLDVGWVGAATGLATVAKCAISLREQILPPNTSDKSGQDGGARYWLRNRAAGPRRAEATVVSLGGLRQHLVLEESECEADHPSRAREMRQPAGRSGSSLFVLDARDRQQLCLRSDELEALCESQPGLPLEGLAHQWFHLRSAEETTGGDNNAAIVNAAIVARSLCGLVGGLNQLRNMLDVDLPEKPGVIEGEAFRLYLPGAPSEDATPNVAFVYPGLGNVFPGMGREIGVRWPEMLRELDGRHHYLLDQFAGGTWWEENPPESRFDHRPPILAQITHGALMTDLFRRLGVRPRAAIGYSLGESSALVSLGAWADRDGMTRRLIQSPLFSEDLAGQCRVARSYWGLDAEDEVDWKAGILPCSLAEVIAAIPVNAPVYPLIINHGEETVVGGRRAAVDELVRVIRRGFVELPIVSTVHCPIGRVVEREYYTLHDFATTAVPGIQFYSGVWARPYEPDRASAAAAITAQAGGMIDFPAVIDCAYAEGSRIFIEMGPGGSCTRLIGKILGDRPHYARSASIPGADPLATVLEILGYLASRNVPINLGFLYGDGTKHGSSIGRIDQPEADPRRVITIHRSRDRRSAAALPRGKVSMSEELPTQARTARLTRPDETRIERAGSNWTGSLSSSAQHQSNGPAMNAHGLDTNTAKAFGITDDTLFNRIASAESARSLAHEAFLRISQGYVNLIAKNLELQQQLVERGVHSASDSARPLSATMQPVDERVTTTPRRDGALDRAKCLEYAVGKIGSVLGPEFAAIDDFPSRVRLPDEPLMLVDRIVTIEGEPRSMTRGRVVTEHDILRGAWYLDAGKIAPSIAIESGQADLFLSGYLGIDFVTRGLANYRLLDATVTFHRGLPGPDAVIRYDIKINGFFRQGDTHLFRFEFDGMVDGEPLLSMRDGCAGFFSPQELASGKGIVPRPLDTRNRAGVRPADWVDLLPSEPSTLDEDQVDALRKGDLAGAFGRRFRGLHLQNPLPLPGGRMKLVDRVVRLDPQGGRFGLGLIRAESVIHPGDWFMVCHFIDDRVMPGTLMYEGCLHTFRIFLMSMGWVGAEGVVAFEPKVGVANRLRCRGQVLESTRVVAYELVIKEIGYDPAPYAIGDAVMYADGKPIVEVNDIGLTLSGTDRREIDRLWGSRDREIAPSSAAPGAGDESDRLRVYDRESILAFAVGKPSEGFGARYRPFDDGRFIARLPGPPYLFLDRIVRVEGEPWVISAGTSAEAAFDILPDAWYFQADRQPRMPYAVLLEVALQVCGWVSAYMGSALTGEETLKYRNLGGSARQHRPVHPLTGTLMTRVRVTKVTHSAGMLLQHFDFAVRDREGLVFEGDTYFGFFRPRALEDQVGVRELSPYELTAEDRSRAMSFPLADRPPFPDSRWRMVDRVDTLVMEGGPHGFGFIEGTTTVVPDAWFFRAHFKDDPVWPGSLGLESFLQLLKVVAFEAWGSGRDLVFESPGLGSTHTWTYRGQIIPDNRSVTVQALIKARDDDARSLIADGSLGVDGKIIYQMKDYTLRVDS